MYYIVNKDCVNSVTVIHTLKLHLELYQFSLIIFYNE